MITPDLANQTVFADPMISAEGMGMFWAAVQFVFNFLGMGIV